LINNTNNKGILYIVPTPIGNLKDITIRAIETLKDSDFIAAEDTRNAGKLLKLLDITPKKLISYYEHNEDEKSDYVLNLLNEGKIVSLISDAGTPLISDPGYKLVNKARNNNIQVIALPGATAFVTALSGSGFPNHNIFFFGFPPQKKGRKIFLTKLANYFGTIILYESSHRIFKLIEELEEIFESEITICVARELTKIYEEYIIGKFNDVKLILSQKEKQKGEFVILINNN
jgi:16S rRNA (cytidine1402-2'-O)-methyltransferase